jgi:uncharacterized protein (DUF849 family)
MRTAKTIITCAVTGAVTDPGATPYLPITPIEIAESALAAAEAGAACVHLHVRDPETKWPSMKTSLYEETVDHIRRHNTALVINLTAGPGAFFAIGDPVLHRGDDRRSRLLPASMRVAHIERIRPDICSVDFNTMHQDGTGIRINHITVLKEMLERINAIGTKPELELFDSGDLRLAMELLEQGYIKGTPLWQFAMGIKYGWDHTPEALMYARNLLPANSLWSAFGISKEEMPMVANTWLLGGHVRVGMEDNIYLSKGVLAKTNAELVVKARRIVEDLGGSIANYAEAREIYKLNC